jgi:hypothetical protein
LDLILSHKINNIKRIDRVEMIEPIEETIFHEVKESG